MANSEDSLIENELNRLGAYTRAKESVMRIVVNKKHSALAQEYADCLIDNGWSSRRADSLARKRLI